MWRDLDCNQPGVRHRNLGPLNTQFPGSDSFLEKHPHPASLPRRSGRRVNRRRPRLRSDALGKKRKGGRRGRRLRAWCAFRVSRVCLAHVARFRFWSAGTIVVRCFLRETQRDFWPWVSDSQQKPLICWLEEATANYFYF